MAEGYKALTAFVTAIIGVLHGSQDFKDAFMFSHKQLACQLQVFRAPCGQKGTGRRGSHPTANHGVIDPLTRRGRNHPGRISSQNHIGAIVPTIQGAQWNGRTLAPNGLAIAQTMGGAQLSCGFFQIHTLNTRAHANTGRFSVRKHPSIKIWRYGPVINHVASLRIISQAFQRRFNNLVISDHIGNFIAIGDF